MLRLARFAFTVGLLGLFMSHSGAQQQRLFTNGTPAEVAVARDRGLRHFQERAIQEGLTGPSDVAVVHADVDRLSMAHTRVQQSYRGVRGFGGEAIVHFRADGEVFGETNDFRPNVNVDVTPTDQSGAAIAVAKTAVYGCSDCLTSPHSHARPLQEGLREPGGLAVQKNSSTAARQKLNSQLLVEIARAKGTVDAQRRPSGVVKVDVRQRALVDVRTPETASIRRMVLAWGSSIVDESVTADSIVAWVPLLRLEELAQSPLVRSIEPAATPITNRQRQEIR